MFPSSTKTSISKLDAFNHFGVGQEAKKKLIGKTRWFGSILIKMLLRKEKFDKSLIPSLSHLFEFVMLLKMLVTSER